MADAMDLFRQGVESYRSGDFDTAIDRLEAATQLDNSNHKAFSWLGAAYAAKNRHNAAIGAFKISEQLKPGRPSVHYNIGQAYEAGGVPSEAVFEYRKALELDPNYTQAAEALAVIEKKLGKA